MLSLLLTYSSSLLSEPLNLQLIYYGFHCTAKQFTQFQYLLSYQKWTKFLFLLLLIISPAIKILLNSLVSHKQSQFFPIGPHIYGCYLLVQFCYFIYISLDKAANGDQSSCLHFVDLLVEQSFFFFFPLLFLLLTSCSSDSCLALLFTKGNFKANSLSDFA